ncbi:hypothetical protein GCM10028777_11780 [Angustibacter speluncae]
MPACTRLGLSVIPFAPLHGWLLAGAPGLRGVKGDARFGGAGFTDAERGVGEAVQGLADRWGLAAPQVSLAWLLSRPAVASVIVGAENLEELSANASAADVALEAAQMDAVSTLSAGGV